MVLNRAETTDNRDNPSSGTDRPVRPGQAKLEPLGWSELIVGAAAYLVSVGIVFVLLPMVEDDAVSGVVGLFVSGAMGLFAFGAAYLLRNRRLAVFGIQRSRPRYLWMGIGLGVAAYLLGMVVAALYVVATGDSQNVQASYQAGAAGGWILLVLTLFAGSVITPIGEEFFFRGVVANVLLSRLKVWIAILASALLFAVAHGINPVLPVAFVVGLFTALLFRWSGSIWPGVLLHGVNNAIALIVPLVITIMA
ncbi:CPBP family intramembrane metalloprotease [Cellulosimicrobium funkei]|nr:CPBP family intramembrane metalloprotease [Cellulosimicrobium funkei]